MREKGQVGADIERRLGELVPVDAPTALRERVLRSAQEARTRAALRPGLRIAAAMAALLVLACLAIDPLMARREAGRLEAVLDGRESPAPTETATELAEILAADAGGGDRQIWSRALAREAALEVLGRDTIKAREGLKGWLENENPEDLH
jgi:hypothetical protein